MRWLTLVDKGQYASSTPPDPSLGFPRPQLPAQGGDAHLFKLWAGGKGTAEDSLVHYLNCLSLVPILVPFTPSEFYNF